MLIVTTIALAILGGGRLEKSLEKAGDNRVELQAVLDYYTKTGESQKHAAACFLIENMSGHNYAQLLFFDPRMNLSNSMRFLMIITTRHLPPCQ